MATIDRVCKYPDFNSNFRKPGGQDSVKQHIKEFDTMMIEVGLVRTVTENQLDVNNINDLDISACFSSLGSAWNYNTSQSVYYAPLEYAFDDSLQSTNPVTMKFEFFFFRYNQRNTLNENELPYFGVKITIDNSVYSQVFWQHPYISKNPSWDYQWPLWDLRSVYNTRKSNICYDKEKGYFFLNYCPEFRYNISGSNTTSPTSPLIFLCVSRSRNSNGAIVPEYLRIIARIPYLRWDNSSSTSYQYGNSTYIPDTNRQAVYSFVISYKPSVDIYQSVNQFQVPYNAATYYNNGNYYTYMSPIYDTNQKIPVYDPFILVGNKIMAGYESTAIYNIKLNDIETKKYLAIAQDDMMGYIYTSSQCILVYYN